MVEVLSTIALCLIPSRRHSLPKAFLTFRYMVNSRESSFSKDKHTESFLLSPFSEKGEGWKTAPPTS
jgi:hypothetical protein